LAKNNGDGGNICIEVPNYLTTNKFNLKELKNPPQNPTKLLC